MLYFIPWVILIVAVIVAVPVAAKMSSGPRRAAADPGAEDESEPFEASEADPENADAFGAETDGEPIGEPLGDAEFEEFK